MGVGVRVTVMVVSFGLGNEWDPQSPPGPSNIVRVPQRTFGTSPLQLSLQAAEAKLQQDLSPPPSGDLLLKLTPSQGGG